MTELEAAIRAAEGFKNLGLHEKFPESYEKLLQDVEDAKLGNTDEHKRIARHKEGELVLEGLDRPGVAKHVRCKECNETFLTNYAYQKYCSNYCLREALAKRGIDWNPERSNEDRWKGEPPSTISPESLKSLQKWARAILEIPEPAPAPVAVENPFGDIFG